MKVDLETDEKIEKNNYECGKFSRLIPIDYVAKGQEEF